MVLVNSTMMPLGATAPDFNLPDTEGKLVSLSAIRGVNGTLIMFICNHCPFVKHVAGELAKLGRDLPAKGINVVAIMSNDIAKYPDDSPAHMKAEKAARGYSFPYLLDESQAIAKAYRAACTPDFFLFDGHLKCVYRGQLDDSRPKGDIPVTGRDLRAAVAALLACEPPIEPQRPSAGCNIKWKAGSAPDYFPG